MCLFFTPPPRTVPAHPLQQPGGDELHLSHAGLQQTHMQTQTHTHIWEYLRHRCEADGWHGPTAEVTLWKSRVTQPSQFLPFFSILQLSFLRLARATKNKREGEVGRGEGTLGVWALRLVEVLIYGSDFSFVIPWLSQGTMGGRVMRGEEAWGPDAGMRPEQLNNVYMPTALREYTATKKCCPSKMRWGNNGAEQTLRFSRFNCTTASLTFPAERSCSLSWICCS